MLIYWYDHITKQVREGFVEMDNKMIIKNMVQKSKNAHEKIEGLSQEKVDQIVREVGKIVYDNAKKLAKMAVDETCMGVYEDKVKKNMAKAGIIWNSLKGRKSTGIIKRDEKNKIVMTAKPKGVIAAVT